MSNDLFFDTLSKLVPTSLVNTARFNQDKKISITYSLNRSGMVSLASVYDLFFSKTQNIEVKLLKKEETLIDKDEEFIQIIGKSSELLVLNYALQRVLGVSCVTARNAYDMSTTLPNVKFIDNSAYTSLYGNNQHKILALSTNTSSRLARKLKCFGFETSTISSTSDFYNKSSANSLDSCVKYQYENLMQGVYDFIKENTDTDESLRIFVSKFPKNAAR